MIVAKYYLSEDVGLASATISSMTFIAVIANLGFGVNSKKLVSILSGAESQTLRGIENFLGYKPFEFSFGCLGLVRQYL